MDNTNALTFYQYYPDKNIKDYVYYRSLLLDKPILWQEAEETLQESLNLFKDKEKANSLTILKGMYEKERKEELYFLQKNKIELSNDSNRVWDDLIKGFNEIYSTKAIFNRNIALVKSFSSEKKGNQVDILNNFQHYITKAFQDFVNKTDIDSLDDEEIIKEVVREAWIKMYDSDIPSHIVKAEGHYKAYEEMKKIFENLDKNHPVYENIIHEIGIDKINDYLKEIRKDIDTIKKNKKVPNFQVGHKQSGRIAGNLLEIVTTQFISTLRNTQVIWSGKSGQKADVIELAIQSAQISLPEIEELLTKAPEGQEKRLKNIERMEKLFQNIDNGDMVFISDKNYGLKTLEKYGGFSAQSAIKVSNLGGFLSKINIKEDVIQDLIFVLTNTGNNVAFLNQNSQTIEDYLATKIGYILFDDVAISESAQKNKEGVHAIHLFNLNNIYIPFSVFLEATYNAFMNVQLGDYHQYVNVEYKPEEYIYSDQTDGLEKLDWVKERQRREKNSQIVYHFFEGFANFINDKISKFVLE